MSGRARARGVTAAAGRWLRFARGARRFVRQRVDGGTVGPTVAFEQHHRADRFLDTLDALVWSVPESPWQALLGIVGAERADVTKLVADHGLEGALTRLRDLGVYLSTEEAQGLEPVRRGSTTMTVTPTSLFNPRRPADFMAGTSGTRSAGTPVAASFASLRRMAVNLQLSAELWDVADRPSALWRPALPGSGGLIALLTSTAGGTPPERWFSQLDPFAPGVALAKRLANVGLPVLLAPTRVPRPEHAPPTDPDPVLAWCVDALRRSGRAALNVYPSSALRLVQRSVQLDTSLGGLVLRLVGEPVTAAKAQAIRATGAAPVNAYAFAQQGAAATACPHLPDEALHVFEHELAVIPRARQRSDGLPVQALCWTNLSPDARSMWINVENDDYGVVTPDAPECPCALGGMGMRGQITGVRGMSKAVTGGVTVPSEVVENLVEAVLPNRFGGSPGDWQLAERERAGASGLEVRADPRLGVLDDTAIAREVLRSLQSTEAGVLATAVWSAPGFIEVVRRSPAHTRSGKTLAFEALPAPTTG